MNMSDQRTKQDTSVWQGFVSSKSNNRPSEIRVVLIGGQDLSEKHGSGRSSVGNIILGNNAFVVGKRTSQSVQASAHIHGRQVTVVDTPSWPMQCTVEETTKFDRLEIMRSPILCLPGAHAFLLVIPVDCNFPKHFRLVLENQLEFLTETVWHHIIVLFSSIAPYDDIGIKNNLKKWPHLQTVLDKCQNRYHILDLKKKSDSCQVIELLEKIERIVVQNNGQYFEMASLETNTDTFKRNHATRRMLPVKRQKSQLETQVRDEKQQGTDIEIVMLGGSLSGKSSTGNLIMGKKVFKVGDSKTGHVTVQCEVGHAEVHGRQLIVVDTPGWYFIHPLEKTSEMDKLEIRRSVHIFPAGPHVILLTVPVATAFNRSVRIAVEEHMSLLGENVWRHTIVLLTWGDWLGDTTIEERIEAEGEHLQWLIEQCGHKYHVLNCTQNTDSTQVIELLEKIEDMVMENNSSHFKPETSKDPSAEYALKVQTGRTNMMKVSRQRNMLQELLKDKKYNFSKVRMILLGGEGNGKSVLGNLILQGNYFQYSTHKNFTKHTTQSVMKQRQIEECQVSVVDTPGWSRSTMKNGQDILCSVTVCFPGPHAFLLVLPVHESFTVKSQQIVEDLMKLFGENIWRHTIIVFYGQWLGNRPVEEYIACEGEALQELVSKCGNRYHVIEDDWSNKSQVRDLFKKIELMNSRNRGEYFTLKPKRSMVFRWLKTLTEEEWMKREDELIERMMKALVVDPDENPNQLSDQLKGSFNGWIPNMSGDSGFSDDNNVPCPQVDEQQDIPKSTGTLSNWLGSTCNEATSSVYDRVSNLLSTQYQKIDIPVQQKKKKLSRSNSI